MKKRTAFIGAILSLIPFGQPLLIKTGVVLSTTGLMSIMTKKVIAETADFYNDRGNQKYSRKDYYGAISDFTKAIEIDADRAMIYANRAAAKGDINDHYGAISDFTKAIEIDPKEAMFFTLRGNDKKLLGDQNGACLDWGKASLLGDKLAKVWLKEQC